MSLPDLSSFPTFPLVFGPTPLQPLDRLTAALRAENPKAPRIWMKRDDQTGLALGGNKARKLEFLIGDALAQGADTIITSGAVQSNHARQTVAAARAAGLDCHLVLNAGEMETQDYNENGNILLDKVFGAVIHHVPDMAATFTEGDALAERLRAEGRKPYLIPAGGSNAMGSLGYIKLVGELLDQADVTIDRIVHASGSGGTQVGLICGTMLAGADIPVLGISVGPDRERLTNKLIAVGAETLALAGVDAAFPEERMQIDTDYIGEAYGLPSAGMKEAVGLLATTEGILLDPVYTGKGMAGFIDHARKGSFDGDENVVFLHTGGAPGLFAYRETFAA